MTWDEMYKAAVQFDVDEGSILGEDAVHFAVQQVNAALDEAANLFWNDCRDCEHHRREADRATKIRALKIEGKG